MTMPLGRWLEDSMLLGRDRLRHAAGRSRKVRKLIDNPSLFFSDMVEKRVGGGRLDRVREVLAHPGATLRSARRDRHNTRHWHETRTPRRYSVVSAVYNVAPYLDTFLHSLFAQTLDATRFLEVILVDDGSTDGSAARMADWSRRHPNIRVLHKPNGGQASARNLGLQHATGDWVSFIDPDDHVAPDYFQRVDQLLERGDAGAVVLVAGHMVMEQGGVRSNTHALRSQFERDTIVAIRHDMRHVQLSAASALFRRDRLDAQGLRFDEELRPAFEDAHFVGRYLEGNRGGALGVCARAEYRYRKRADGSSTLDGAWSDARRYDLVWERGYLDLLRLSARHGKAALWAQRAVLYELMWFLRVGLAQSDATAFLSPDTRARCRAHVRAAMAWVEPETVVSFELAGAEPMHRTGILGTFMGVTAPSGAVIDAVDPIKREFRLRYYTVAPVEERFTFDGCEVGPRFGKVRPLRWLDADFVLERLVWLPCKPGAFEAWLGGTRVDVESVGGGAGTRSPMEMLGRAATRRPNGRPNARELPWLLRRRYRAANTPDVAARFRDAFLFMDRDTHADDNAEHLYRYTRAHHPEVNAWFVLRRSSPDWRRLEDEGFRLLAFDSGAHRAALMNATHVVSSQADYYVTDHPGGPHWKRLRPPYFTFLQHGVINYDLSAWLNAKPIDCMVTSSQAEFDAIVGDGPYRMTRREVVLSGMPRHDALLAQPPPRDRVLLTCPTWRESLVGSAGASSARTLNPAFHRSAFAQTWKRVLHSAALRRLLRAHGVRHVFLPHPNLVPYIDGFELPDDVEVVRYGAGRSVQPVLAGASLMLTDYSSVAFEMAYLHRPVVYYQFDREVMFGGGHTGGVGHFDYRRDGFGPVVEEEADLLRALSDVLERGSVPNADERARMDRTFAHRDGRCCERTLRAVMSLTAPHRDDAT